MYLIVGLGNPGKKYQDTRHNLGFKVINELLNYYRVGGLTSFQKFNSEVFELANSPNSSNSAIVLLKPQIFMNASGRAVAQAASFYKISPENIWVIYDDLDLVPGQIKIRQGGGAAGHRGVLSIINQLRSDQFIRFRLGIGHPRASTPPDLPVEEYVLQKAKTSLAKKLVKKTARAVIFALEHGLDKTMNHYNS